MKMRNTALVLAALAVAACQTTTPAPIIEGEYSLSRIEGVAINGQPMGDFIEGYRGGFGDGISVNTCAD